jgi:single-strand DNA-binding protein
VNETLVTIVGNVVADPERRTTKAGVPFAAFRVASTVRRLNLQSREYEDGGTSYYNVTAFRSIGANVWKSLKKGEPVMVHGRQRVNQFVRADNSLGTTVEIDAYHVGHDLGRGTTVFAKVTRAQFDDDDRLADPAVQAAFESQGLPDPETVPYDVQSAGEEVDDEGPEAGAGDDVAAAFRSTGDATGARGLDVPEPAGA